MFSQAEYPAYFGGFNNGKTFALCLRAWLHSLKYPNNRGLIARRQVKALRDTTRAEFFKIVGCNETTIGRHPMVDRWNQTENMLRLKNGSEIFFRHVDDEDSLVALLSLNLRWFGIDQAEEVPEAAFLYLISRIGRIDFDSQTGDRLPPRWGAIVGNPAGHNWVWARWKKDADRSGFSKNSKFHLEEATTLEGPYSSPRYIADLKAQYPEKWYKRYVMGSWDVAYGLVYDEWDEKVHVIEPFDIPDVWKAGIGVDLGYNHPSAFAWMAVDYGGNWIAYDEHVKSFWLPPQHANVVKGKGIKWNNGDYLPIFGPHDAMNTNPITGLNYQSAYASEGIYMSAGTRMHPIIRITKIKSMLSLRDVENTYNKGINGSPRLFVFKNCEHLRDEFSLYRWKELRPGDENSKPDPDEVVKTHDDVLDAMGQWSLSNMARYVPDRPVVKSVNEIELVTLGEGFDLESEIERLIRAGVS